MTEKNGSHVPKRSSENQEPHTLAIDIGGTALKASILDSSGRMVAERPVF